jgi:hypothetical protein
MATHYDSFPLGVSLVAPERKNLIMAVDSIPRNQ